MEQLFLFLAGHALADYVLQTEMMLKGKRRSSIEHKYGMIPPWYYWLTSHAFIHGGIVYLITDSLIFGVIETVLHWGIDFWKCENRFTVHQDQGLHIICKLAYCLCGALFPWV